MKKIFFVILAMAYVLTGYAQADSGLTTNTEYVIRSAVNPNYVIDLNNGNSANGTNITLWEYNGGDNQKWVLMSRDNSVMRLHNKSNLSVVLDLNEGRAQNGENIQGWHVNGSKAQDFRVGTVGNYYEIVSDVNHNYVVDANNGNMSNGTNITIWVSNGGMNQRWIFEKVSHR